MVDYKTLLFHPDNPNALDTWLQHQYTRYGWVLIAVYGDWFIFRTERFNEL